jgi:hypothetical protein
MMDERTVQAVRNNAIWCDVVCRAHGRPGKFLPDLWINHQPTPRFYPNVVTLTRPRDVSTQLRAIALLDERGLTGDWGVKDSFCALDLAASGFQVVVEAHWLWRPATLPPPRAERTGIRWARIKDAAALTVWEAAWEGPTGDEAPPLVFLPGLLAGAVASRTDDVVGLSNVFTPAVDGVHFWAGCVAGAMAAFPGLPLVGYEGGEALSIAQTLGFATVGPLRVWIKI